MLENFYSEVDVMILSTSGGLNLLKSLAKSFYFGLFKSRRYSIVTSWFVGYHSLIPFYFSRLFGVKTVAFLGGTECHNMPEIDHGNYRKRIYGWFTSCSLRYTDIIFPVHESLIRTKVTYTDLIYPDQGILAFNKEIKGKIVPLHCGFEEVEELQLDRNAHSFLTVSSLLSGKTYVRKGVDLVVELAKVCPEMNFTVVGSGYQGPRLHNLKVIESVSYDELKKIYREHEFYLQLSIAEGFPNALAEAMAYGCIPIGSTVFGIPDIIDDCGFLLERKDLDMAKALIEKADKLSNDEKNELSRRSWSRIRTEYTFDKRYAKFKDEIGI